MTDQPSAALASESVTPIRVWHDDIRPAPEGWTWVRTNDDATYVLANQEVVPGMEGATLQRERHGERVNRREVA